MVARLLRTVACLSVIGAGSALVAAPSHSPALRQVSPPHRPVRSPHVASSRLPSSSEEARSRGRSKVGRNMVTNGDPVTVTGNGATVTESPLPGKATLNGNRRGSCYRSREQSSVTVPKKKLRPALGRSMARTFSNEVSPRGRYTHGRPQEAERERERERE